MRCIAGLVLVAMTGGWLPGLDARTARAAPIPPPSSFVVVADTIADLGRGTHVMRGSVGSNLIGAPGVVLRQAARVTDPGSSVVADSVRLARSATVVNLVANQLTGRGQVLGDTDQQPTLPVWDIPAVEPAEATDIPVQVAPRGAQTLAAGRYGSVSVGKFASLILSGGAYQLSSLTIAQGGRLLVNGPVHLHITGPIRAGRNTTIAPVDSLATSALAIHAATADLPSGDPGVRFGNDAHIRAILVAPAAKVWIGARTEFVGAVGAHAVTTRADATLRLDGSLVDVAAPATTTLDVDVSAPETVGSEDTFQIVTTITNSGGHQARATAVRVTLPGEGSFVSGEPPAVPDLGRLEVATGDLAPGATAAVTVVWQAPSGPSTLTTVAEATSSNAAAVTDTARTTVSERPPPPDGAAVDLTVSGPSVVAEQTVIEYTVTVTVEPGADAVGAELVVALPTVGTFGGSEPAVTPINGSATWTLGDLPAGGSATVVLRWTAPSAPNAATVVVTISAANAAPETVELTTLVEATGEHPPNKWTGALDAHNVWNTVDDALRQIPCGPVLPGGPVPTLDEALDAADAYIASQADQATVDALLADPRLATPADATRAAAAAFIADRPGAAVAALVAAHRMSPADPAHLRNLAVALNRAMLPLPALAVLDRADDLGQSGRDAVGWDVVAVAMTARGHALLALGRWAEAVDVLTVAHTLEPTMPEVLRSLAVAHKCAGDSTGAFAAYRQGARRSEVIEVGVTESLTHPAAGGVFDLRHGSMHRLALPSATGVDIYEAAAQAPQWMGESGAIGARSNARFEQMTALLTEWGAGSPSKLTRRTSLDIRTLIQRPDLDPAVGPAWEALREALRAAIDFGVGYGLCNPGDFGGHPYCEKGVDGNGSWGDPGTCLADLARGHAQWTELIETARHAWVAYQDVAFPYWTGLQANVTDPLFHEYLGVQIDLLAENDRWGLVNLWTMQATFLHSWVGFCTRAAVGPSTLEVPDFESTPDPAACPPDLSRLSVTVDFEVLTLKSTCEQLEVEGSFARFGPIVGFLKGAFQNSGEVTVFAGSKFDIEGIGSFDSALYITTGADGEPADIGWEVGPEVEVGHGVKLKVWEDKMRFSFVATARSLYP
jgi:hypothetical protein